MTVPQMLESRRGSVPAQDLCCNPECFPAVNLQALLTEEMQLMEEIPEASLLSPPSLHEKDIPTLMCEYVLFMGYCLLPRAVFQSFPLFSPPKESVMSDYNTQLTFIVCFSL